MAPIKRRAAAMGSSATATLAADEPDIPGLSLSDKDSVVAWFSAFTLLVGHSGGCRCGSFAERRYKTSVRLGPPRCKISDHRHSRLLCARRKRPCYRRAAEQRDELTPRHSITSSARASSVAGISMLIALAVFRLMTKSNFVARWTGRSPGFSPLRMRPA